MAFSNEKINSFLKCKNKNQIKSIAQFNISFHFLQLFSTLWKVCKLNVFELKEKSAYIYINESKQKNLLNLLKKILNGVFKCHQIKFYKKKVQNN